jgi:DNA helicase-2/ATP-dependent DNA helicase PcrA
MAWNNNGKGKPAPKPFPSKYPGFCRKCKTEWKVGDMIKREGDQWVHSVCPVQDINGNLRGGSVKANPMAMLAGRNVPVAVRDEDSDIEVIDMLGKRDFIPSVYQQAAFDWALKGSGNAVMQAVAGSGKTTTITKMLEILPRDIDILFVAFNKTIVKALIAKIKAMGFDNITVRTLNSSGYAVCRKYEGFEDLNPDKVLDILTEMGWRIDKKSVPDPATRTRNRIKRMAMKKVVEMVKGTLADFNNPEAVLDIINRFHIEIDEEMEQEIIETLPQVMEQNNADLEHVDYNDQCYLPVVHPYFENRFDQYDFILCDEFQDFNKCNTEYILRCLKPNGRIIAVGDHHQSLYGFRGADPQAIPDAIKRLNATVLPLSICYRCPRIHVEMVKDIVPEIEPSPTAKEGTYANIEYKQMMEMLKEGDMVICRTNAPLVKPAFAVIKSGRKAIIRGKNIGDDLIHFIETFNCDELGRLDILMQQQTEVEMARYIEKNKEMMAEQVKERYETIAEVARECRTVEELLVKLKTLFSDDNIGVVFSSIHRAKGLEAENIFWFRRDLCPHPKAKSDDEKEQELNAIYVAGTRSLDALYIVAAEDR